MKWSFVIQQKFKAAILLGGIMALIVGGTLISRYNVEGIDESFSSIYKDRLVPATTILYLTENLYRKRLSLENYLYSEAQQSPAHVTALLRAHDRSIDSLIRLFEKTYLVDEEAKSLQDFKSQIGQYARLEGQVLAYCRAGSFADAKQLFSAPGSTTFESTILNLNELAGIQSTIGKDLMKASKVNVASFGIISFLQISLAIITGLVVIVLIRNSQIIQKPRTNSNKSQYFNLN
ncbi:MCP four helix bundle domain-containing protein [Dyadobacter fermentans]|uniref:MCP four helix bundle domain-containing protein n=1 Tax=Dyadobacter fermentans TaxID=94254 RepID=UPI001CC03CDC|nr:MCP four helix bundle domain-containing protein [Dyadobacter fermentans]MBZ1362774.1 MCP four helix bundle domain-containing protein [Dyadobacter fermentans]